MLALARACVPARARACVPARARAPLHTYICRVSHGTSVEIQAVIYGFELKIL